MLDFDSIRGGPVIIVQTKVPKEDSIPYTMPSSVSTISNSGLKFALLYT